MFKKSLLTLALASSIIFINGCSSTSDQQKDETLIQTFRISEGMEVQLNVPEGFKLTREHYGFVQPESFSRIKVTEVEVPYPTFLAQLSREYLLKSQLQLIKQEEVDVNGAKCTLLTLRQVIAGTYYEKLWLLAGDSLSSIKIEASYPESSSSKHKSAIKESLFSTSVQTNNRARLYTGLPYYFTNTENFKIVQRNLNSIVLASNSLPGATVVVSHGKLAQPIENDVQLGRQLFENTKSFKDHEVLKQESVKVDGIPAKALHAYVEHANEPAWVYQVTSSQKNKFLLIQAVSKKDQRHAFATEVQSLLNQFKFK